jgi:hypothetical protein
MKTQHKFSLVQRWVGVAVVSLVAFLFLVSEADAQRRRGGFGGGGSFGGSRSPSYSPSRPSAPSPSSGMSRGSFGGARPQSAIAGSNYRSSYGIPRQSSPMTVPGASSPYMVHSYGGYGDGLMAGYLMGRTSMMWSMPFHPAFYYSRPVYVTGANGAMEVYPPTFSFFRLFMGLFIMGGVVFLVVWLVRRSRRNSDYGMSQSSFS